MIPTTWSSRRRNALVGAGASAVSLATLHLILIIVARAEPGRPLRPLVVAGAVVIPVLSGVAALVLLRISVSEPPPITASGHTEGEQALSRLASIVESSEDAILSMSLEGRILTWNQGAERLYGYPSEEVVGRSIQMILPPDRRSEADLWLERVARGEPIVNQETEHLTKYRSTVDLAMTVSPIVDDVGNVTRASIIARDSSNERWMKATLDSTLQALETAVNEARESESATRRFLADAAHQLRSPMAGIRASAETFVRGAPSAQREQLLANLIRDTSRAGRLMTGLLHMARVDQGAPLAPNRCDIVSLCAEQGDRVGVIAPALHVELSADDLGERLPEVDGDAVREILSNLLDNARRHAATRIGISVREGVDTVEVRVDDDGPGLAEHMRERAFERFVSLDGRGGSGLGLPIARGLARAHGGDLLYDGKGFLLRLPMRTADPGYGPWGGQVAPSAAPEPQSEPAANGSPVGTSSEVSAHQA